jgi:TonB-linked SusC/RagA family outer membrane protein
MITIRQKLFMARYLFGILLLFFCFSNAGAQTGVVKGTVKDTKGNPLAGVTVQLKGSNKATSTSVEGNFSINANNGNVLLFRFVGFQPLDVTVGDGSHINVTLTESHTTLNDVVVVGYGTSSRQTLTSSISTIKQSDMNQGSISDVGQLLQGKVPGLNITASGDPNGTAAVILRGASTVNSPGSPYYVIDGIPGADISAVAPNDIVSIDVLKDAAATAIYGNKASSGVIMVTTRRGKKGQSQITYSGYEGMEKVSSTLNLMNSSQLNAYLKANNAVATPGENLGANTNWMDAIERSTAYSQNHNLSLTGGGEHSTYAASLNYFNKEGILSASSLQRVIGRLNIDQYALNDKLKFSINLSNSYSTSNNEPLENIVLLQAAKHLPMSPVKNSDGTYFEDLSVPNLFNPVAMVANSQDKSNYNVLLGAFDTELKLPFGLKYNINLDYEKTTWNDGTYYSSYFNQYPTSGFYSNPNPGIGISHSLITFGTNGLADRQTYANTTKTIESFLTWDKSFGKNNINAVLGYSYQQYIYGDGFQTSTTNFPTDNTGFENLSLANPYAVSGYRINQGSDFTYGTILNISDFLRVNYNYDQKYLFQGSIRRDGSSVFGANNYWGYFPSAGLGWVISKEDFMNDQSVFNNLKLRASYGVTGNSSGIGAYTAKLVYGTSGTFYDNGIQTAAYGPIQGSNPDLKWERTATADVGVDFSILKGKLSGDIDVYNKNTTNMLFQYSVSQALVPGGSIWTNGGSINNKGIELGLSANPVSSAVFSWTSSLSASYNKNKITSLKSPYGNSDSIRYSDPEGAGQTGATLQILKVGQPLGEFFAYKYAGKDANGNSLFYKKGGGTTTTPTIGTDYFYLGSPQPKVILGWSNTFRYKNLDLNIFLRGTFGNKIFDATRADLSYTTGATEYNLLESAANDKMTDTKNSYYSDRYVENGSYVKLDNATLGYNFKMPFSGVSNIRVYFTGNNLLTVTGYKGIDPEINQGGISPGIDYNNFYPKTRTLLVGAVISLQ